jgi:hypothetical protein
LKEGFLKTFRASPEPPPPSPSAASPIQKGGTRGRAVVAIVVILVLVIGGIAFVVTDLSAARPPNLFANGGFQTGNLQGWQTVPPYLPTVESSMVEKGSSHAARFQTPTNDPTLSSPCLTVGVGCGVLNTSTIYQNVYNLTVSQGTGFSFAVYPAFQFPSAFQMALEFGLSPAAATRTGYSNVLVYYLVLASPQQCSTYSSDLLRSRPPATSASTYCLSTPQGSWTPFKRDIASDLPSGISPSELDGSMLTLSVSFAGASGTDEVYVGSLYLG